MRTWKKISVWMLLSLSVFATHPVVLACDTCNPEAKVRFQLRGITKLAGHVTVNIYIGEDLLTSFTLSGPPAVWDGSRYVAQSFACVQWPSNVTADAKLNQPVFIRYMLNQDDQSPDYSEFAQVSFDATAPGNPLTYLGKPSSKCLKIWADSDDGNWVELADVYYPQGNATGIKATIGDDETSVGDAVSLTAGGGNPIPDVPELTDSTPIGDLLSQCPAGGATSSSSSRTASTADTTSARKTRRALVVRNSGISQSKIAPVNGYGKTPTTKSAGTSSSNISGAASTAQTSTQYSLSEQIGRLRWEMSLGSLSRKQSLGRLVYQADALDASAYSRALFSLAAGSNPSSVIRDAQLNLRQVRLPDSLIDLQDVANGVRISAYPGAQISGFDQSSGLFTFTGQPSVTWVVDNPDGGSAVGRVRFTKTTGDSTEVHEASWQGTAGVSGTMTISRYGGKWTEQRAYSLGAGGTQRIETVSKFKGGTLQSKVREVYQQFNNWGQSGEIFEALVQRVQDPDGQALTTTYEFWDDPNLPGNLPSRITHPDGYIEWMPTRAAKGGGSYPVYSDGALLRLVQSYKDSDPATGVGKMSYTQYTLQSSTQLVETKTVTINGTQVGYSETDHNFDSPGIWRKQIYDSADASGAYAYREEWIDMSSFRPLITLEADGRSRTYTYTPGSWNAGTQSFTAYSATGVPALQTTIVNGSASAQSGIPNKTTTEITVTDQFGHPVLEDVYVNTGGGTALIDHKVHTYTDGRRTATTRNGKLVYEANYDWEGRLAWEIDESGRRSEFIYDEMGRVFQKTVRGRGGDPDQVFTYDYDVEGRKISETRTAGGLGTVTRWSYNLAGDLVSTTGIDGLVTTTGATYGTGKVVTETLPTLGTRVTSYFKDRQVRSITGTAVEDEYFDPFLSTLNGGPAEAVSTYRDAGKTQLKQTRTINWLGNEALLRTLQFHGGNHDRATYYDIDGNGITRQLVAKVTETGRTTQLFSYDNLARLTAQGLDFSGNGTLDAASSDRMTTIDQSFSNSSGWEDVTTVQRQLQDGADAPVLFQRSRKKSPAALTGNQIAYETIERDGGGVTINEVTLDRATGTQMTTITDQELGQVRTRSELDGLVRSETLPGIGGTRNYTYTAMGEVDTISDPLTGALTNTYDNSTRQLTATTDSLTRATNYLYYSAGAANAGLLKATQDPGGQWTYFDYYPTGKLRRQWGLNVYPVEYQYDEAGNLIQMTTWRTKPGAANWASASWPNPPGGDATQWVYDTPSGLLQQKTYADGKSLIYSYDAGYFLDTKTNGRGQVIDYTFDGAGQLKAVSYSDGTPGVTMGYDRAGRRNSVTDASGSRSTSWTTRDQIEDENYNGGALSGVLINRGYDAQHRLASLEFTKDGTSALKQSLGYDSNSWVNAVTDEAGGGGSPLHRFDYTYKPGTPFVQTVAFSRAGSPVLTQGYNRDGLNRLSGTTASLAGGGSLRGVSYQLDALDRRYQADWTDGTTSTFGYNDRSEVISGRKKFSSSGTFVGGSQFEYGYDDIGNRTVARFGGDASGSNLRESTYGDANAVNQLTTRTVPGFVSVTGEAPTSLTLQGFVDSQPFNLTRQDGQSFYGEASVDNSTWNAYPRLKVVGKNGSSIADIEGGAEYVPKTPESFAYDPDGNLTSDGRWTYTWDAENRLIQVEAKPEAASTGAPKTRLVFAYDADGRRFRKELYLWDTGTSTYQLSTRHYFVYDQWNLIGELNGSLQPEKVYQWGLDLSGPAAAQHGAGGVGGLLAMKDLVANKTYYYSYDANGNVQQLVDSETQGTVADYTYGPFGEPLRATGAMSKVNPFRFSSKFEDQETGLLYYGYRYYQAEKGKWIARDPLGDSAFFREYTRGLSDQRAEYVRREALMPSYGFVRNDPVRLIDNLGLTCLSRISVFFYNSAVVADYGRRDGVSQYYPSSGRQFLGFMRTFDSQGNYVQGYQVKSGGNRDLGSKVIQGDDTSVPSGNYTVGTAVEGVGYPIETFLNRSFIRIHNDGVTTGCIAVIGGYSDFQRDMADTRDVAKKRSIPISIGYHMGDRTNPPHGNTGFGTGDPGNPNFDPGADAEGPPSAIYNNR